MLYQSFMDVDQRNSGLDQILNSLLDQIRSGASKSAKVLALQAIQTLTISVGDDAFGERIQINFDWVLDKLNAYVGKLALPDFFDFIVSFVQMYHGSFTENNLQNLLQAMVSRVMTEQLALVEARKTKKTLDMRQGKVKKTKKSSKNIEFRIAKCWSVIRYVAEHEHFTGRMVPIIEQCSIPLLQQFMQAPDSVNFDDDIIFFISSLLKKSKSTNSAILREAFPFLPKFLSKFNYIFGPLLECISLYTLYSGVNDQNVDWIATSEQHLQILFDMAKSAMFPPTPQNSPLIDANEAPSYAIEGALVLQNIFQNLNGAPLLD